MKDQGKVVTSTITFSCTFRNLKITEETINENAKMIEDKLSYGVDEHHNGSNVKII